MNEPQRSRFGRWAPELLVVVGICIAAALTTLGLTLAVFPLAEPPAEEERYEYAFAWIGLSCGLLVAALAAWSSASSTLRRLILFGVILVVAVLLCAVMYFAVASVACQEYGQCLNN